MKSVSLRLLKDIVIYGTGDIIFRSVYFITLPIFTRIFTTEEYGIWNFVNTTIGLLNGVLILGGDSAYARYFFEAKTIGEKQLITSTWFGFLALWSIGIVVLCLPLTDFFSFWSFETEKYRVLFILALITAPISMINTMCGQVLRNQFRALLFTALNILSAFLIIGLSLYGVLILDLGLVGIFGGTLLATLIILPFRLWTVRTMLRIVFSVNVLKNLLVFGVPLVPTSLAYWVFTGSDRIIIGKFSTLDQLGLYSVASVLIGMLSLLYAVFGQAWSPHAFRMYEEEPEVAPVFFGQVMTYILIVFGALCVGMATFARELLMILSTPIFYPAALAIGPLALGFVAYGSTQITASGISLRKKTKYFFIYSWIAALLNLGLNILFVPRWGMMAASWTTAISYIFLTVAYAFTSQRLWPVQYEKGRMFKGVTLIIVFTVVAGFFPEMSLIFSIIFKSLYCFTFIGLLIVSGVLDKREWGVISALVGHKLAFANFLK